MKTQNSHVGRVSKMETSKTSSWSTGMMEEVDESDRKMVNLQEGGKRTTTGQTTRGKRTSRRLGERMKSILSSPSLVILFVVITRNVSWAGFSCLTHCNCFYKSNKLLADCGSQGLQFLPQETSEERSKGIRGDIQILNLTRNTFNELKGNIFLSGKLVNLQRIYMSRVGLERVDKLAFHPLTNLVELDLSSNRLKSVPTESFYSTPKLRELDLSSNHLFFLPPHSFRSLINLKMLNLEKNDIHALDSLSFEGLSSLEILKLSDNKLTLMDSQVLVPLFHLHSLTMSGNPWRCDCQLRQLRQYLLMIRRVNVYDEPKCFPSEVIWTQMDLDSFICPPRLVFGFSRHGLIHVRQGSSLRLECAFYVSESPELVNLPVKWLWQGRPISNNSRGILSNQIFSIDDFEAPIPRLKASSANSTSLGRKMKVSRLEVSLMLDVNQGIYSCICENKAGSASHNFSVLVSNDIHPRQHQEKSQPEEDLASLDDVLPEDNNSTLNPSLHKKAISSSSFPSSHSQRDFRLLDEDGNAGGDSRDRQEEKDDREEDQKHNPHEMVDPRKSSNNNYIQVEGRRDNNKTQSLSLLLGVLTGAGIVITSFIMSVIVFARKRRVAQGGTHRQLRSSRHHPSPHHLRASSILSLSGRTRLGCRDWTNEEDFDLEDDDVREEDRNLDKLNSFMETPREEEGKLFNDILFPLSSKTKRSPAGDSINPVVKPPRLAFTDPQTEGETSITMTSSTAIREESDESGRKEKEDASAYPPPPPSPEVVWSINSPSTNRRLSPSPPELPPFPTHQGLHLSDNSFTLPFRFPPSRSASSSLSVPRDDASSTSTGTNSTTPLPLMDPTLHRLFPVDQGKMTLPSINTRVIGNDDGTSRRVSCVEPDLICTPSSLLASQQLHDSHGEGILPEIEEELVLHNNSFNFKVYNKEMKNQPEDSRV